jgi:tetratricopeptide (TPR) repeat protein
MRDALAIFERLTQRYPRSPHYRERLEEYYGDLYPRLVAGGRASDAERTYDRILALQKGLADDFPSIARYHEQLAWTLVMCPYESLCDESLAVAAARRCVELQPTSGNYWRTLGGAYYRAATAKGGTADWSAAIEALEKSMSLPPGPKAANRLFLAMSHWQLASSETGRLPLSAELQTQHREQARELYRQAAERLEKDESVGEGTQRLLAEAAELLEIRELQ